MTALTEPKTMPAPAQPDQATPPALPTVPPADTVRPAVTDTLPPVVRPAAPPPEAAPPSKPSSGWRKALVVGIVALFAGTGIGYAAGMPGKNDMKDQRDTAVARGNTLQQNLDATNATLNSTKTELEGTNATLASTEATLTSTKADLATTASNLAAKASELSTAQANLTKATTDLSQAKVDLTQANADLKQAGNDLTDMTANRDMCLVADQAAMDLVDQWENFFDDLYALVQTNVGSAQEAEIAAHMDEQMLKMSDQHDAMHELATKCQTG